MHVLETDKFLFYCAGKTGTRTLKSIPGIVDVTVNEITEDPLRKRAKDLLIMRKELTGKQIVIVIRDPVSRMYSGLFEVIAKIVYGPFIEELIRQDADLSFLTHPSIWSRVFERCIRLTPKSWVSDREFESHRWQYHIGNWMLDAETISEIFSDSIVLNLKNLSVFLEENNIQYIYQNKFTNILSPENEDIAKEIFNAFKTAIDHSPHRKQQILDYLQQEIDSYCRLNNRQYYIIGN